MIWNSSTITSIVEIYKNVPADKDLNIDVINNPYSDKIQPIPTPIGFIKA